MRKGLAVSLPARELIDVQLPGSVVPPEALKDAPFSPGLRAGMTLLEEFCGRAGAPLLYVGRPEIFTHNITLAWLRGALRGIGDHVCFSDGSAIKLVPGMRNHLFFHAHGSAASLLAFEKLTLRAPEIAAELASQINSAFSFPDGDGYIRPRTQLIQADTQPATPGAIMRTFYLNPNSAEDSVNRMDLFPPLGHRDALQPKPVLLVPFTDAACADADFCRAAADHIIRCSEEESDRFLVLAVVPENPARDSWPLQCLPLLAGLRKCGRVLPRAVLRNVAVCAGLPGEEFFADRAGSSLVCHDSFPVWRLPRAFYARFADISLVLNRQRQRDKGAILKLWGAAMGRPPHLVSYIAWGPAETETSPLKRYAHA